MFFLMKKMHRIDGISGGVVDQVVLSSNVVIISCD